MNQSRLYLSLPKAETHEVAALLDPFFEEQGISTALYEDEDAPDHWCWTVYVGDDDLDATKASLHSQLAEHNIHAPLQIEKVADIDWVSHTLRELAPVKAGRFFVHGSHDKALSKNKIIPVEIDAGLAFGTGHHGTTAGCLDMLERILRRRRPVRGMDVGTGSGVLAIALAKALHIPVLATDIDPVSTKVAKANARINGVGSHIRAATATGFQHPAFKEFGQADIIFANILARPLEGLAHPMRPHVAPGGEIILSGLLPHQQSRIVNAYRRQGLLLEHAHIRDGWLTLLMYRP